MTDNEKRAHDLAILYEIITAINPDTDYTPQIYWQIMKTLIKNI